MAVPRRLAVAAILGGLAGCAGFIEETGRLLIDTGGDYLRNENLGAAAERTDEVSRRLGTEAETRRTVAALEQLGAVGDPTAYDEVEPYLRDSDARIRLAAVRALRADRSTAAVEGLVERLGADADDDVRVAAAALLAEHPGETAFGAVRDGVLRDRSAAVRRAIVERLGSRAAPGSAVRDVLLTVRESDPDATVREVAGRFLAGQAPADEQAKGGGR